MIKTMTLSLAFVLSTITYSVQAKSEDFNTPETPNALAPYHASYTLFRKGSELGKGQRKLEKTDSGYHLSSSSNIKWLLLSDTRKENSDFSFNNNILTATEYHYNRTGTGRDRQEHIIYNSETINSVYKNNKKEFRPIQLTYDPLLYQVALRQDLISNKEILSYHMVRRGKETNYTFERIGTPTIKTPLGRFDTIKLKRVRKKSSRETYIWIAPELNYSVVKMTHFKDGQEQADLQINNLVFD